MQERILHLFNVFPAKKVTGSILVDYFPKWFSIFHNTYFFSVNSSLVLPTSSLKRRMNKSKSSSLIFYINYSLFIITNKNETNTWPERMKEYSKLTINIIKATSKRRIPFYLCVAGLIYLFEYVVLVLFESYESILVS